MRLVSTPSLKPGMVLAQSICNEHGLTLIRANVTLTDQMIKRLIRNKVNYVYVQDIRTKDIVVDSIITNELRTEAIESIKNTFTEIDKNGFSNKSYILNSTDRKLMKITNEVMTNIQNSDSTITLLADIFETDDYTFQHSLNVAIYSLAIGVECGFSQSQLSELGIGAILHDIGKIFIDRKLIQKNGGLTANEYEEVKKHPKLGFDYIRNQTDLSSVIAHCAYQHHERMDGSGYPRGLKGDHIHKYGKIVAIADVFDAVTSNRSYREALLPHEGLEIIYAGAVDKFDIKYIEAFKKSVAVYPNGLTVQLNDGRKGVVAEQNKNLCDRPVIQILEEYNEELSTSYELNLAIENNITITSCFAQ